MTAAIGEAVWHILSRDPAASKEFEGRERLASQWESKCIRL